MLGVRAGWPWAGAAEAALIGEAFPDELVVCRYPNARAFVRMFHHPYYEWINRRFRKGSGIRRFEFGFVQPTLFEVPKGRHPVASRSLVLRFNPAASEQADAVLQRARALGAHGVYSGAQVADVTAFIRGAFDADDPNPMPLQQLMILRCESATHARQIAADSALREALTHGGSPASAIVYRRNTLTDMGPGKPVPRVRLDALV